MVSLSTAIITFSILIYGIILFTAYGDASLSPLSFVPLSCPPSLPSSFILLLQKRVIDRESALSRQSLQLASLERLLRLVRVEPISTHVHTHIDERTEKILPECMLLL